jgi:hypothetical protein
MLLPSCTERYTRSQLDSNLHDLAALAIPSEFLPIQRLDTPARDEWMATFPDGTEIVVADIERKDLMTLPDMKRKKQSS